MGKKRQRLGGGELVFDPEDRKKYLKGFSERKRQRRAYGLAMQKVKDRKSNLEQRAERRKAVREQIEQAEKQKENLLESTMEENEGKNVLVAYRDRGNKVVEEPVDTTHNFEDVQTVSQWGGKVIVTTSTNFDDKDEEQLVPPAKKNKKSVDVAQEYAGSVERFMTELKGNLPGKKRKDRRAPSRSGKQGSSKLKGVVTGSDAKLKEKSLGRGPRQSRR